MKEEHPDEIGSLKIRPPEDVLDEMDGGWALADTNSKNIALPFSQNLRRMLEGEFSMCRPLSGHWKRGANFFYRINEIGGIENLWGHYNVDEAYTKKSYLQHTCQLQDPG